MFLFYLPHIKKTKMTITNSKDNTDYVKYSYARKRNHMDNPTLNWTTTMIQSDCYT